jgi:protocatechuate 3,4-dioxygenase beta subunit
MDTDDKTIGRLFSRREALATAAKTGLVLVAGSGMQRLTLAGQSKPHIHIVVSPEFTEGPFFVDEKLNRSDLVAGATRPSVVNGLPLLLSLEVYKLVGDSHQPLRDAHIDVWHADAARVYSDESNPMNHEDTGRQTWLRGYQATDARGSAQFKTIFPGWYSGRAPHIHFKVRTYSTPNKATAEFTSQLFFRDADAIRIYAADAYSSRGGHDTSNSNDGVFNDFQVDGKPAGSLMLLDLAKNGAGYKAHFAILLDDSNLHGGRLRRP